MPHMTGLRTIFALILREMATTYGRSPGGYLWAVVQPVGILILFSLGFSLLVRTPPLGTSFILFYATGFLPFELYGTLQNRTSQAMSYNKSLLAYPRVTWIDAVIARATLAILTEIAVFCIVISGILAVVDQPVILAAAPILTGFAIAILIGLGVGMLNSVLFAYFPIWRQVWGIVSRPLFLASGLFYTYETLPSGAQAVLWWNPLLHATGLVRTGFYPTYEADYVSLVYCFGLGLGLVTLGLIFLRTGYRHVLQA